MRLILDQARRVTGGPPSMLSPAAPGPLCPSPMKASPCRWSRPVDGAQTDVEMHDRLSLWARQAQQNFTQGLQQARTIDWSEQVHGVRESVTSGFQKVSSSASAAGASFSDHVSQGMERAKTVDWSAHAEAVKTGASRSLQSVASTASSSASSLQERLSESNVLQNAREGAVGALSVASERVSGAASLAMEIHAGCGALSAFSPAGWQWSSFL
ncbi:unnamed protein product [Effrenium voratum]|nr:unnamed protein product [Effrenium voratum]